MRQTIKQILAFAAASLKNSETPRLDAEILLAHFLKVSRAFLYTHTGIKVDSAKFARLLNRRIDGEPIAYIIGKQEFWSMDFVVSKDVLIPRPETELLVETALIEVGQKKLPIEVLDLGTGTGAIALSLGKERPKWKITAIDNSEKALKIARKNRKNLQIKNVKFKKSNWYGKLKGKTFAVIVANPPYIAENDPHLRKGNVRFEPKAALISDEKGLNAISEIIKKGYNHLVPGGLLLLEHGYDQKCAVKNIFYNNGFSSVTTAKDLAGNDRISFARKK